MYKDICNTMIWGEVSDYRPPPIRYYNTDPSRISLTIRDINKLYIHELLVI